jgi:hypothetical protein
MSSHTYHPLVLHEAETVERITVTAYSSDDSGNPVGESEPRFTHYEATWIGEGDDRVHGRGSQDYTQCASLEQAYQTALDMIRVHIREHRGNGFIVQG